MAVNFKQKTSEKTLWLWGDGSDGALGDNAITHKSSPVQTVAGGITWSQISCGYRHTMAIKEDGTLWGWGRNTNGQVGNDGYASISSPIQTICGGTDWKYVACGDTHTAAIKTDGTLWTWGKATTGQLGDGSVTHKSSPVQTIAGGNNWVKISCGEAHTAGIKTDGTLWSWGTAASGRLGDNTVAAKSSPVQTIAGGSDWSHVTCGYQHTIAIKTDGTLWAWGSASGGCLGDNGETNRSSPVQETLLSTSWYKTADSMAGRFSAATKADGTLWLWGQGGDGQLGTNAVGDKLSAVQTTAGGTTWKQVSAGSAHTTATKTDGTLWTWGNNVTFGHLGDNTNVKKSSPIQTIAGGTDWTSASAGKYTTMGITDSRISNEDFDLTYVRRDFFVEGNLWMWGKQHDGYKLGYYGQLGDNTTVDKSSPVQTIAGGTNWKQISCGTNYTTGIKADGTLWAWGNNGQGGLGDNTATSKSSPVQTVAGGTDWNQVGAGNEQTAAIKTDGTLWLWGRNISGELGDNTSTSKSSPIQTVTGGQDWAILGTGYLYTAAIKVDGTLWMWGDNSGGQLGNNANGTKESSPVQTVAGGTDWKTISGGISHVAAIKTDGTLWTWGVNSSGQLGDNTVADKSSPVQTVAGGTDWKAVTAGSSFTAAIKTDGTLWLWGNNSNGELGDNTVANKLSPVQTVTGGTNWKKVAAKGNHALAIKTDGTLWTWGKDGYGALGDNTNTNRSSPVQTVAGGTNWAQISASGHSAGLVEYPL